MSNFNFQWTKTYYQNNLSNIAFFFTFFKGYIDVIIVICNNTKENFLWEAKKTNVKFHKMTAYSWNFQNFTFIFTILVKFDIYFLGLPWEIVFGVITDNKLYLYPLKNVKRNAVLFKLFWYKVFVLWKLKFFNFLMDSVLISFSYWLLTWYMRLWEMISAKAANNLNQLWFCSNYRLGERKAFAWVLQVMKLQKCMMQLLLRSVSKIM